MMTSRAIALLALLAMSAQNPASFECDEHHQRFIKTGTIYPDGRCLDVYSHSLPAHRVVVPCATS